MSSMSSIARRSRCCHLPDTFRSCFSFSRFLSFPMRGGDETQALLTRPGRSVVMSFSISGAQSARGGKVGRSASRPRSRRLPLPKVNTTSSTSMGPCRQTGLAFQSCPSSSGLFRFPPVRRYLFISPRVGSGRFLHMTSVSGTGFSRFNPLYQRSKERKKTWHSR